MNPEVDHPVLKKKIEAELARFAELEAKHEATLQPLSFALSESGRAILNSAAAARELSRTATDPLALSAVADAEKRLTELRRERVAVETDLRSKEDRLQVVVAQRDDDLKGARATTQERGCRNDRRDVLIRRTQRGSRGRARSRKGTIVAPRGNLKFLPVRRGLACKVAVSRWGGFIFPSSEGTPMTPTTIRARLLTAQLAELRLIVTELKATRPDNMTDLANVCIEAQAEIRAAAVALQSQSVRDQTRFSLTS